MRAARLLVTVFGMSLALTLPSVAAASSTVVDTRDDATTTFIGSFGVPNTATYGQLVTIPAGDEVITSFTFRVTELPATDILRAEIYAWDGTKATGPSLYESPPTQTTGPSQQDITFSPVSAAVVAGQQYVLLVSTSKDFEASSGSSGRFLTRKDPATYEGGEFVYLNNGTNEEKWTTDTWSKINVDLQFRVRFATRVPLTVTTAGTGSGVLSSSDGRISCGPVCSTTFVDGEQVTLSAKPRPGSAFKRFVGGGCSVSPCTVNMDGAQSVVAVFKDVKAPLTKILKRTEAKIRFKSSEPKSSFRCKLDKHKWRKCKSPFKLKNLAPGKHKFKVAATDSAGNRDKTPAKVKFTVE